MSINISNPFINFLSPAKLNLGLKITGIRADGYHSLNSVFCLVDLFDEIRIQITPLKDKISIIEHNQAWHYKKDLVYKAAMLLKQATGCKLGANIKVKKTIPSGAGLGGGSSNAATTLIALNQLWKTGLSSDELIVLGIKLGADVPFFLLGKNAFVSGIGEILTPIDIPEKYFVIIMPDFHLSTKHVFEQLQLEHAGNILTNYSAEYLIASGENDLLSAAIKIEPQINKIMETLKSYAKPMMTGSGSALYLTFDEKNIAKKVAKELSTSYNTFLIKSLKTSPIVS